MNAAISTLQIEVEPITELFSVGEVSFSPDALLALQESACDRFDLLRQHQCGAMWAEQPHVEMQNLAALTNGDWITSSFDLKNRRTLWFFTEPNRATTLAVLEEP